MKIYEKKEVPVIKKTLTNIVCDVCGNNISVNCLYYEVRTGHRDWGNDSIDSIENKDICSDECLQKEFNIYMELTSRTKYMEIEREKRTI